MSQSAVTCASEDAISLSAVVLKPEHHLYERLQALLEFYRNEFGHEPDFFVRMPGRVNIIGEHVDYCGYPVLPMAIDQCILLAVGQTAENTFLQLRNVEAAKYGNFKCDLKAINIDLPAQGGPQWYNYYLCGVKGIYETLEQRSSGDTPLAPIGMCVALSGNIPPASGLSSSSALVSAAVLATAHVHALPLERKQLAAISARCERYIGTQGGGMDQAIAYLARRGYAQFIEFHPTLNATPIELPAGACFIVANSLAPKNKAASSDFNERVVECRLATRLIAKRMQFGNWRELTRFMQLQEALQCTLAQLEELVLKWLPNAVYTRAALCADELEVSEEEFERAFLTANTRHLMDFKLRQRALHVVQESLRVAKFRAICEQSNGDSDAQSTKCCNGNGNSNGSGMNGNSSNNGTTKDDVDMQALDQTQRCALLSQLMRQSHDSLQRQYECSHPDLDRLVAISDALGVGARLTGAGWGGCIVACCESMDATAKYIQTLKEQYFATLPTALLMQHQHNDFKDVVFATLPGNGAEIFTLILDTSV